MIKRMTVTIDYEYDPLYVFHVIENYWKNHKGD